MIRISEGPLEILNNPILNKGSAFTDAERDELGLHGLLPFHVSTMEEQLKRRYENFCTLESRLDKYIFLMTLQNRNEILFFRFLLEHMDEILPLIYTPTVGDVSVRFSVLYHQHRGLYLTYPMKNRIEQIIANYPLKDVDVVVATDGERILGLGDWGAGGMAISMGKLALYTLFGGIHPGRVLPIMLDVGTDNQELIADPMYIGWRHERVRGEEYDKFVDCFIKAIKKKYPKMLLQWEDFGKPNAANLLFRYQKEICSFNDDIQGTAAVVLAAVMAAVKSKKEKLSEQRIAILGAGSAGLGIARLLLRAMEDEGLSQEQAIENFFIVDRKGLLHSESVNLDPLQKQFAQTHEVISGWKLKDRQKISLFDVIINAHPTILIGVSTQEGAFTEEMITTMNQYCNPIILPLSNPKSKCEAKPEDLVTWTEGSAVIATGSPFDPVEFKDKTHYISQCNNLYIFPGVGLGAIASKASQVDDEMFVRAANILSNHSPLLEGKGNPLFPPFAKLREVSREIAIEIAATAQEQGFAPKTSAEEIEQTIDHHIWFPEYPTYIKG